MATYPASAAALTPLASGADDSPAPAIEQGEPINVENLIASKRQLVRRESLYSKRPRLISNDELAEAERRHHVVKSLHFDVADGEHVPRWVQNLTTDIQGLRQSVTTDIQRLRQSVATDIQELRQSVATDIQELRQSVATDIQELRQSVATVTTNLATVTTDLQGLRRSSTTTLQLVQQAKNRGIKSTCEALAPVIRNDGTAPEDFPATPLLLTKARIQRIERWLNFYGLDSDAGTHEEKRQRLYNFLCVNILSST